MLNLALSALLLVSISGFGQKKTKINVPKLYVLSGTIKGDINDNGYAYLYYNDKKDSTKIIDKKFEFKGSIKDTLLAQIGISLAANAPQFYLESSKITIQLSANEVVKNGTSVQNLHLDAISGSRSFGISEEYKNFYQSNAGKKDFNKLLYSKLSSFIHKHRSHPFSGAILAELALVNPILTKKELNQLYALLDVNKQNAQNLALLKKGIEKLDDYGVGKPFLDFNLPDQKGNMVHLKDYRGKLILIDFWASWCKPCREKNPELRALNEEFRSRNFEIIGISSDQNKKQWSGAIAKDQLTWMNVLDEGQIFKNSLGIEYIPYNYLIDEKGIIIGVNLQLAELKQILNDRKKGS
jgi:peroxiredoxin